jgi:hypothetical protein
MSYTGWATETEEEVVLKSPNGTRYRLTVSDGGALSAAPAAGAEDQSESKTDQLLIPLEQPELEKGSESAS